MITENIVSLSQHAHLIQKYPQSPLVACWCLMWVEARRNWFTFGPTFIVSCDPKRDHHHQRNAMAIQQHSHGTSGWGQAGGISVTHRFLEVQLFTDYKNGDEINLSTLFNLGKVIFTMYTFGTCKHAHTRGSITKRCGPHPPLVRWPGHPVSYIYHANKTTEAAGLHLSLLLRWLLFISIEAQGKRRQAAWVIWFNGSFTSPWCIFS